MFTYSSTNLVEVHPASVGMYAHKLVQIDDAVNEAIKKKQCPGAVVLVSRFTKVVWFRAYGNRCVDPHIEPMTRDTMFDVASLTKSLATATAIMMLIQQGKLALDDCASKYLTEFCGSDKEHITIEQLLRHRSGLPPDSPAHYYAGMQQALKHIRSLPLLFKPGTSFCYSCIGYIVLCEIIQRVSGKPLDIFAHEYIFAPLKMNSTMFNPPQSLVTEIAPATNRYGTMLRGQVHDPRAYSLGGVSGNAGLFSCAQDIATFAHMILNNGKINTIQILDEQTTAIMTSPETSEPGKRYCIGWDIDTFPSSPPHNNIPLNGFGHQGFTGTFLWIDPSSYTVIITLTNRLHPDSTGDAIPLQKKITSIVADAIIDPR